MTKTALPAGLARHGDLLVPLAVIAMVVMMVIPLPPVVLDLLLAFNLTIALVVLLVTMFTTEPLQFSIFPSLLLITTLFRLALNVSSTRLILLHGYAGQIIQQFGQFVVGGNALVGLIVFLILVVIQFVVITKGAERVAEVAARFTLDAMPGKQMSIDADLNAGLLSEDQARQRRREVEREADFYGAMDGASKFVKGDAIAGLIITVINFLGGIAIGVLQRGMPFADASSTYSLLTVGDGLVSQIPALLISTATGITVTRAASEASMGRDLVGQLLSQPKVMQVASMLLFGFGLVPGLPRLPFFVLGALSLALARSLRRAAAQATQFDADQKRLDELDAFRKPEAALSLLHLDPLEIELGYALVPLAERDGGDLPERISVIRRQLAMELGMVVPPIRILDNIQLQPNTYVIRLRGVTVARGQVYLDRYLGMNPGNDDPGIEGLPTREPAFGLPALWLAKESKERAELAGLTVVDPPSVLATHLTEVIKAHAGELLGRQEVQALLDALKTRLPAVVEELVPGLMTLGEVQKVLQNLLRESISIRDLGTILETLADLARGTKDTDILTEQVRQSLSRMISSAAVGESETLHVVTLAPGLEESIMAAVRRTDTGVTLAMEPELHRRILTSLAQETDKISERGRTPVVLCSPLVRLYFRRLTERVARRLTILSYNELDPDLTVEAVGVVSA
ncbi:MAG: flagellar biosynthesis protein FlhA [Bacillota bacterium]|nr:flagellar biosynthesis protein FlhA [Bacillota bacterium]